MRKMLLFILALAIPCLAGIEIGGEVNTTSNLGSGEGVYYQKTLEEFELKSLTGESGLIDVTSSNTEIEVTRPTVTNTVGRTFGLEYYDDIVLFEWIYTVWVTTAGNDSTGDGTAGTPYLTLQKAIDKELKDYIKGPT